MDWLRRVRDLAVCAVLAFAVRPAHGDEPKPGDVARRVDELLLKARDRTSPLPPLADDVTFLRRAMLDRPGKIPAPDQLRTFAADRDVQKRGRLIDRLLKSDDYAVNWGRYWRDALTYHTPASGNYLRWKLFDDWLTDQVRANRKWSDIVTDLVTASGINDESAPVNFLTAHFGNPVEIAATTSRVFLGAQMQCPGCHDA